MVYLFILYFFVFYIFISRTLLIWQRTPCYKITFTCSCTHFSPLTLYVIQEEFKVIRGWVKPCREPGQIYPILVSGPERWTLWWNFFWFLWISAGPRPFQYRVPEFHATLVVTSPVFQLSCKTTPHLNLLHPHSLLFTCTLHGHLDLLTRTYQQLAGVETQETPVKPSVGIWFHWKTWPPGGMASARGGEERSDGRRKTCQRNSFADSGVSSDTRPITGHSPA